MERRTRAERGDRVGRVKGRVSAAFFLVFRAWMDPGLVCSICVVGFVFGVDLAATLKWCADFIVFSCLYDVLTKERRFL